MSFSIFTDWKLESSKPAEQTGDLPRTGFGGEADATGSPIGTMRGKVEERRTECNEVRGCSAVW
jgi:hypothetical protein